MRFTKAAEQNTQERARIRCCSDRGTGVTGHRLLVDDGRGQSFEDVDVRAGERGHEPLDKLLYVSLIRRCDSAAIVPNTNELLPDPETPVNTVRRRFGIVR